MEWICFRTTDPGNHIGMTLEKINEVDPSCQVQKDPRRSCKFCTYTVQDGKNIMHHSYFANENPKLTSNFCFQCKQALCNTPPTTVGSTRMTVVSTIFITTDSCRFRKKRHNKLNISEYNILFMITEKVACICY
jgi:hypothetical protein